MNTNGKQFITLQVTILAVFGAIIIFTFQLMDTKVERTIEQTVRLMERISVLETRVTHDEQRLDKLYDRERRDKNDNKSNVEPNRKN